MSKKFKVIVNTGSPDNNQSVEVTQGQGGRGQPVRLQAKAGAKYQLLDLEKVKAVGPDYVKVKRVGKHLHILFEDSTEADVIIENYYEVMPEGYNGVVGQAENGNFYEYIPEDPDVRGLIPLLADGGQAVSVALGGAEVVGAGAAVALLTVFNPLLAGLGLVGAGAAAAAVGSDTAGTPDTPANIGGVTNDNTPTFNGKGTPGEIVTIKDGDKVVGTTTVNPDGSWSFTAPVQTTGVHSYTASTPSGGTSAPFIVTVDTTPPRIDISSNQASLSAGQTATITFSLSEASSDFTWNHTTQEGDITVTGGTLGALTQDTTNPLKYTAVFTPTVNSAVNGVIEVKADKFKDAANNVNTTGDSITLTVNTNIVPTPAPSLVVSNDAQSVAEAGAGVNPSDATGNVLTNDTGNLPTVSGVQLLSASTVTAVAASTTSANGTSIEGQYGTLVMGANGSYKYTVNNSNVTVQGLRTGTQMLSDIFVYTANDGTGPKTANLVITVTGTNDAPTVTTQVADKVGTVGTVLTAFSVADNLADVDSASYGETATLPVGSPITGSYNNAGLLTFEGVATIAQYEQVLNSVRYHSTRDDLNSNTRMLIWTVQDEAGLNSTVIRSNGIRVNGVNDAPVLPDANYVLPTIEPITTELGPNGTIALQEFTGVNRFLLNVTDADDRSEKGIAIVGVNSAMGKLYLSVDGGLTWTSPVFEVNSNNAILLINAGSNRVYFRPNVGVEGEIADALTIRAWDRTNNLAQSVVGKQVTGYAITAVGGTTAYSSHSENVSLTVASRASSAGFNGTPGDDEIIGSIGVDVILANGGVDQIKAGESHDKIVINADNVEKLAAQNNAEFDGEADINILKLSGSGMFLDLTNLTVQGKLKNFSALDITGNGANTLKLNANSVENLSGAADNADTIDVDESKMLVVQADLGDVVILENTMSWVAKSGLTGESLSDLYGVQYGFVGTNKYTQFSQNGATLFVDELAPVADIVGTNADDVLQGTASAEVMFGNGGADQISAYAGNDTVILDAKSVVALGQANAANVDGGDGVNVLKIVGVNVSLDLTSTTVASKLENFSVLDMSVGNGNTVKLSLQQVLDLPVGVLDNSATSEVDESKMLVVNGSGFNTLQLVDSLNWSAVTNLGGTSLQNTYGAQYGFEVGRSYTQYTNAASSATLFVDQFLLQDLQ